MTRESGKNTIKNSTTKANIARTKKKNMINTTKIRDNNDA